jgi:RNA polymerase sigma-70 factor (ECF subfamily)
VTTPNRDREARFRALYGDAYGDVLRFVQRRVDPSQAEDVAADTFLVAWRRLDDAPDAPDDRRAWLFGIARRCLLNARRGEGRRDALAVRVAGTVRSAAPVDGVDADPLAQLGDLATAWRRLSETDQEALSLAVFDDLTSAQAARVLGVSAAAYRVRLLRARRALRRRLDPADVPTYVQMETTP